MTRRYNEIVTTRRWYAGNAHYVAVSGDRCAAQTANRYLCQQTHTQTQHIVSPRNPLRRPRPSIALDPSRLHMHCMRARALHIAMITMHSSIEMGCSLSEPKFFASEPIHFNEVSNFNGIRFKHSIEINLGIVAKLIGRAHNSIALHHDSVCACMRAYRTYVSLPMLYASGI